MNINKLYLGENNSISLWINKQHGIFLTAYDGRRLFESTEIAGNKTFTEIFQINFSWLLGKQKYYMNIVEVLEGK